MIRALQTAALLAIVLFPAPAEGSWTYSSPFGFRIEIPDGWVARAAGEEVEFRLDGDGPDRPPILSLRLVALDPEADFERRSGRMVEFLRSVAQGRLVEVRDEARTTFAGRPARTVEWLDRLLGKIAWSVYVEVHSRAALVMTFRALPDEFPAERLRFERVAGSLELFDPPPVDEGWDRFLHPAGLSMDVPAGWTWQGAGNTFRFEPPEWGADHFPLVVAVTAPAPDDLRTLDDVARRVRRNLEALGLGPALESDVRLGGQPARSFAWTGRGLETTQVAAFHRGALIVLTVAVRESGETIPPSVLDRIRKGLRLE